MKRLIALFIAILFFGINIELSAQKVIKKISDDACKCIENLIKTNEVDENTGVDELMEKCMLKSIEKNEKAIKKEYGDDYYDNPTEENMYELGIEVGKFLLSDCPGFLDIIVNEEKESGKGAEDFFDRAEAFYAEGNYKDAINEYKKAITSEPDNAEFFNSRGVAYYASGRYYYAISDFINAIRLKSNYAMAYYNLAQSKNNLKDYESALEDVKTSILYNPEFCTALNLKGLIYNSLEKSDSAYLAFAAASQCDPTSSLFHYNMGYIKYSEEEYDEAVKCFNKATESGYEDSDVYNYLGNSLDQLERFDEAVEAHTKYIESNQEDYVGYYNRGLAHYHAGEYEKAIEDFLASAIIDDSDPDVFLKLAQSYDITENNNEALENFNKIIEMDPEKAEYYDARAAFHAGNGDYQLAIDDSRSSLNLYPNDCNIFMLMSKWYKALGDESSANKALKVGLEMGCTE